MLIARLCKFDKKYAKITDKKYKMPKSVKVKKRC